MQLQAGSTQGVMGWGRPVLAVWLISPEEVNFQVGPDRSQQQPKMRARSVSGERSGMCKGWRQKELGTFKNGKEVQVAGVQGEGSGGRRGLFPRSQRASRTLTGAAKELAFLLRAVGTH